MPDVNTRRSVVAPLIAATVAGSCTGLAAILWFVPDARAAAIVATVLALVLWTVLVPMSLRRSAAGQQRGPVGQQSAPYPGRRRADQSGAGR